MKYLILILFFASCSELDVMPSDKEKQEKQVRQFRKDSIVRQQGVYYNDLRKHKKKKIGF
jgi:hypothetical protein